MATKRTAKPPESTTDKTVVLLPAPRLNLHNLDALRREAAKVYRDMRTGAVDSQTGARLVYVLGEIRKLIEAGDLERRLIALEAQHGDV